MHEARVRVVADAAAAQSERRIPDPAQGAVLETEVHGLAGEVQAARGDVSGVVGAQQGIRRGRAVAGDHLHGALVPQAHRQREDQVDEPRGHLPDLPGAVVAQNESICSSAVGT